MDKTVEISGRSPREPERDRWNPRSRSSRGSGLNPQFATTALNGSDVPPVSFFLSLLPFFSPLPTPLLLLLLLPLSPCLSCSLPVSRGRENGIVNYGCVLLLLATSREESFEWATQTRAISLKARRSARVYLSPGEI